MSTDSSVSLAGREIDGFRVDLLLGKGGMGEVYRAFDPRLQRTVALKVLSEEYAKDREFAARFEREARAASALDHQNIARVYTSGRLGSRPYYAMEYLDGGSLADLLAVRGRLPGVTCLDYLAQAAEGLRAAHEVGIVHRDVKPENLMLDGKGRVKIVDFGLARRLKEDVAITGGGMVVGSPRYMAPEQAMGEEADHRSDIYSLGATIYHLLSGEPPFDAPTPVALMLKHVNDPVPPLRAKLPSVPDAVERVVERMLAKSPGDRYQTYDELLADLLLVKSGRFREVAAARARTIAAPAAPRPDRSWMPPALAVVVLLVGFTIFIGTRAARVAKDVAREAKAAEREAAPIPANWNVGAIQTALQTKTLASLKRISTACEVYLSQQDEAPPDLDAVIERFDVPAGDQRDGWERPIRYEKLSRATFRVSSAGPDGSFGSADDLVMENGTMTQGKVQKP